jgi:ATP-dependent DNA helicase RecQ
LNLLKEAGVAHQARGVHFTLKRRDVAAAELEMLANQYAERGDADKERLERMLAYAQSALCRWKLLLEYFGEAAEWDRCGHCDNCLQPVQAEPPRASIGELPLRQPPPTEPAADRPSPLRRGEVVRLPEHGHGEVVDIQGDKILVAFADGEQKLFRKDFVERDTPGDGR